MSLSGPDDAGGGGGSPDIGSLLGMVGGPNGGAKSYFNSTTDTSNGPAWWGQPGGGQAPPAPPGHDLSTLLTAPQNQLKPPTPGMGMPPVAGGMPGGYMQMMAALLGGNRSA